VYLVLSLLGSTRVVGPLIFAFHICDIALRARVLRYVLQSVYKNGLQVISTLLLGFIVIYLYTAVGYSFFKTATVSFADGAADCSNLLNCWRDHLDFGLRGPPFVSDDDAVNRTVWHWLYNVSWNIFITFVLVAIITGIIIDTFAELRSKQNEISDDILTRCFICSIDREIYDRHHLDFASHIRLEHNMWMYLFFRVYLKVKLEGDYSNIESDIASKLAANNIQFFPIREALVLRASAAAVTVTTEELAHQLTDLDAKIGDVKQHVSLEIKQLAQSITTMSESLSQVSKDLSQAQKTKDTKK